MKNLNITLIFVFLLSLIFISTAIFIQITASNDIPKCSYLDPITIDILAGMLGLFLIVEGMSKIIENKRIAFNGQITRAIRIATGFVILTLHILQFLHK